MSSTKKPSVSAKKSQSAGSKPVANKGWRRERSADVKQPQAELDALARANNVSPLASLRELQGDFWPNDKMPDEFIAEIRRVRSEAGCEESA